MSKVFDGLTVLDLTQAYSGPYCTIQFADFGAEVIKIELPGQGDLSRGWAPIVNGKSGYFTMANRNKMSITLNLRSEEGVRIFLDLAKTADVVIENFRPGYVKKLGVDYEKVKQIKPDIIYASLSGFGQYGPEAERASFAIIAEAMSGHMDLTGFPDGPPVKTGPSIGDTFTGLMTYAGILMALLHRMKTGEGQYIDVAMCDSLLAVTECAIVNYSLGENPTRIGNRDPLGAPYDTYKASDGWYVMAAGSEAAWHRCARAMGMPELIDDPRFQDMPGRKSHQDELTEIINNFSITKTRQELVEIFMEAGLPVAPIMTIGECVESEQFKARDMIKELQDPKLGKIKIAGIPIKMSTLQSSINSSAPELGEHNMPIYSRLGLSQQELKQLAEKGVI